MVAVQKSVGDGGGTAFATEMASFSTQAVMSMPGGRQMFQEQLYHVFVKADRDSVVIMMKPHVPLAMRSWETTKFTRVVPLKSFARVMVGFSGFNDGEVPLKVSRTSLGTFFVTSNPTTVHPV